MMKNKSSFVRKHGFGVVGMLLLGVLGMGLFSAPAEAFSWPDMPSPIMSGPTFMPHTSILEIFVVAYRVLVTAYDLVTH